jgi:hypothetical protein
LSPLCFHFPCFFSRKHEFCAYFFFHCTLSLRSVQNAELPALISEIVPSLFWNTFLFSPGVLFSTPSTSEWKVVNCRIYPDCVHLF